MIDMIYENNGNLKTKDLATLINAKMLNAKKVSRVKDKTDEIEYQLKLIAAINNLPEYEVAYQGFRFDEIRILKCLSAFVAPSRISYKTERVYDNLKVVYDVEKVPVDLRQLKETCDVVNSEFKCNIEAVAISDLRKPVTLDEARVCVSIGGEMKVRCDGDDYTIYTPVIPEVGIVVGYHVFNETAEFGANMFLDYLRFDS